MARLKHSQSWYWSVRLALLDCLALLICGVISTGIRGYAFPMVNFGVSDAFLVVITCLLGLTIVGGYDTKRDMSTLSYASEHLLAMGVVLGAAFIETYVFSNYNDSIKPGRSVLFLALVLFTLLSLTYRFSLSNQARRDAAVRFVYVVGTVELAARMEALCRQARFRHPLRFIDIAAEMDLLSAPGQKESASGASSLWKILSGEIDQCEGIIVDFVRGAIIPELQDLLLRINLHNAPVYPVESFIETYFHKIDLSHVTLSLALDGTFKADHHSAYGKLKTLLDLIFGLFFFILSLPVMLLTALVIKVFDAGPVLFTQMRTGRFGDPFVLYKFRTMSIDHGENTSLYTLKGDSRITRIGRILRLTRLDELPQLWNVVRGDMSIIGPRAEWDKLVENYRKEIPFYHLRHMVKPGITGWAQVNYGYGADVNDACEKLQYDLYYIKHCSPQMDASIILKTFFTMLSASGR